MRPVKVAVVAAAPSGRTLTYSGVVRPRIESSHRLPRRRQDRGARRQRRRPRQGRPGDRPPRRHRPEARREQRQGGRGRGAHAPRCGARQPGAGQAAAGASSSSPRQLRRAAQRVRRGGLRPRDSAEAQLRQAANAASYATLKADKAGIVTAVTGEPGQVVSAGQAVIAIAEAGAIEIAIAVPEQDAGRIAVGQRAAISAVGGAAPRAPRGASARSPARPTPPRAPTRSASRSPSLRRACASA